MNPTLLIVDDSPLTRALIRAAVLPEGVRISGEASHGEEAAPMAASLRPDLVTVDMNMPGMAGPEVVRAVLEASPLSRVIVVTARHEEIDAAERAGAEAVVFKPFPPEALARVVRNMLAAAPTEELLPEPASLLASGDVLADFKEVGNIGAGNAAARLSEVIHRRCVIGLPDVFPVDAANLLSRLGRDESIVTAVRVKVSGDVPATILVLIKRQHAHTIVKYATDSGLDGTGKDFTFTAQFALRQLSDALTASFTGGVNELLGVKTKRGAGEFLMGPDAELINAILGRMPPSEKQPLAISCDFRDAEESFEGKFVYILESMGQDVVHGHITRLMKT